MEEFAKGLLDQAPAIAGGMLVVVAFAKGWIVPGWLYQRAADQLDRAEDRLDKLTGVADRATTVAEVVHERANGKGVGRTRSKPRKR